MAQSSETERVFIFIVTDWPLGSVAIPRGVVTGVLSSDVALYHIQCAVGNRRSLGVVGQLPVGKSHHS